MAENNIKDFVKKQTTPITIGVPKHKSEIVVDSTAEVEDYNIKHVGRPKCDIEKTKISVYVAKEAKEKLIRIQHDNYKQTLNDVVVEAINDLIKKYGR